ncbi:spermidine/putrescine ABC transporter ATP-binding protein [Paenibacillus baekrokdamisoli]|uniref:Carnitine transport ATP-binding protein OpuCA n=1 Tax=Paenibacillus baekrokdamisoli TaxID=1712516 RepID=A0A3G9J0V8_9BACL|nr:ABC transporter ATP-binding protein [Paenibacillus baekrokdamisoli]MBB3067311.1 putative spermidine/putrescine transport system ATP-binding protein [Paenibacillus baekrokdamisoli]BBH19501.1 spermidine/putrescine ABC transporter ATP-binding protein [Paenibacillus baekrokdamisoli]
MSYVHIDQALKQYADSTVLKQVSLQIEKGELVTLLGPSGCGKSTLLRAIAGLEKLDGGTISVNGNDISHLPPQHRNVGMVFQSYALFPNMTVFDNIAFGLKMRKMPRKEIAVKVNPIIELIHMSDKASSYPHQLSGGQQQRVALARALVTEPDILLLDEPLSALDAKIRKSLQIELRNIQRELKMTMIFVTHDQEEAMTISDRIFIMNGGNIVHQGKPEDIYASPKNEFVARFIGSYNVLTSHELGRLTGHVFKPGSYAIRPEVMELHPLDPLSEQQMSGMWISGIISSLTVRGNVRRYSIQAQDMTLLVDELNVPHKSALDEGLFIKVWIPADECNLLNKEGD